MAPSVIKAVAAADGAVAPSLAGHARAADRPRRRGAALAAAAAAVSCMACLAAALSSASPLLLPGAAADGLGCEGYQMVVNTEDWPFTFKRDVGLRMILGTNISKYCSNWRSMSDIPDEVTLLPPWELEPTLHTWECKVRTLKINEQLVAAFPMSVKARGCGQANDEHFELQTPEVPTCTATLTPGENPFNIKLGVWGERAVTLGLPKPHSFVHFCAVSVSSSPTPLEVGDTFTIDFVVNDAPAGGRFAGRRRGGGVVAQFAALASAAAVAAGAAGGLQWLAGRGGLLAP